MIQLDHEQGTPEWLAARLGVPSASAFDSIITPAKLGVSAGQGEYMALLLAEWWLGAPVSDFGSGATERGTGMENEAAAFYAVSTGQEIAKVGFCLTDDRSCGCSPDRLVGEDGLLEIKCPLIVGCMAAHLNPAAVVAKHRGQTQGQLFVTGRRWVDLIVYHPSIPATVQRIEPCPDWQAKFAKELPIFAKSLADAKEKLTPARDAYRKRLDETAGDSGPF